MQTARDSNVAGNRCIFNYTALGPWLSYLIAIKIKTREHGGKHKHKWSGPQTVNYVHTVFPPECFLCYADDLQFFLPI